MEKRNEALKNQLKSAGFMEKNYKTPSDEGVVFSYVDHMKSAKVDFIKKDNGKEFPCIWLSLKNNGNGSNGFYDSPEQVELILSQYGFKLPIKQPITKKIVTVKLKELNEHGYPCS